MYEITFTCIKTTLRTEELMYYIISMHSLTCHAEVDVRQFIYIVHRMFNKSGKIQFSLKISI
jgi:hypothetical protein